MPASLRGLNKPERSERLTYDYWGSADVCGIAGLIGVAQEQAGPASERMLRAIAHRGPDGHGIQSVSVNGGSPAILIHTRLAILELSSAGRQPMQDHPIDGATPANWVVFNGELFNYADLHAELASAGWSCRTRSDTEVLLHAYRVWGESCVERFRGMFAWCLADPKQQTVWLCRDRLGIKPLYLFRPRSGGLVFASEVRALLAAGPELVPPRIAADAIESFLAQGAVIGEGAIIDGVEQLPPGSSLTVDWSGRSLGQRRYWSLASDARPERCDEDRDAVVARLGTTLRDVVQLRLISDRPLGLFLSGGVDSGALATIATEVSGTRVRTLSVGFDQPEFDETAVATAVARTLGTDHSVITLTGSEVLDDIPDVLAAADQPTVDGFNTFIVSRAARRAGLTVALSGLGGDELFGGYASFRDVPRSRRWQSASRFLGPLKPVAMAGLRATGRRSAAKAAELVDRPVDVVLRYLLRRELFLPRERRSLHKRPENADPHCGILADVLAELRAAAEDPDPINQVSRLELSGYMRHMLLRDADAYSMANGIELRVPLLDHKLIETVARLPGRWKRPDPRPKPLLIDAVGKRLPEIIHRLPKKGFTFPWGPWLRGPLRDRAARAVADSDVWSHVGINPGAPSALWNQFLAEDRRISPLQPLAFVVLHDYIDRHGLRP
ncbi:MAG: asparagine synthase (glutamine-hydrolyzing) [Gemmataceae bacterium]